MVVNVSSPNTPGLRDLQAVESLRPILQAVLDTVSVPVLVKIAPDLSDEDVDAVADLAIELGLAGIVATNTTIRRDGLKTPDAEVAALGAGGLSRCTGRPSAHSKYFGRLYARVGDKMTIISVGGIENSRPGVGAHPRRRDTGAGIHRLHLRRTVLGSQHPQGHSQAGPRSRLLVDRPGSRC